MTLTYEAIGIYDEAGYTYDGDLIGNGKPPQGGKHGGKVRGHDDHLVHIHPKTHKDKP